MPGKEKKKKNGPLSGQLPNLFLAAALAGAWLYASNGFYQYEYAYFSFRGLNVFPLAMWLWGLFLFYCLYLALEERFLDKYRPGRSFWLRFLLYCGLYWIFLIALESFGYHVLGIRNVAAGGYPGLPFCDCIHAPSWMQAAYLMMGPLYFLLCEFRKFGQNLLSSAKV